MEQLKKTTITVQTTVAVALEKVWKCWTTPEDIVRWNQASDDWHTTDARNDLWPGGRFSYRMEAKDGSIGFDFWGIYDKVTINECIESTLGDGRKMMVTFTNAGNQTKVVESFEAEGTNPVELQRAGWQAILDNFKKVAEAGLLES